MRVIKKILMSLKWFIHFNALAKELGSEFPRTQNTGLVSKQNDYYRTCDYSLSNITICNNDKMYLSLNKLDSYELKHYH